ncbi:MAG: Peptidase S26B, signal peptidase [Nitrosopumilales archaeon]|jgi:signal peptidase|nr:MAG: Peptidase S26B, signal peptidase [Nitrosopumilales archaeon]
MKKRSSKHAWIKDIVIVGVGVLTIWIGLQVVFGTENPFYVVSSGSMVPQLKVFDVLVVQGNDPFESVVVDDIIVFNRPAGNDRVIVHRVVELFENEEPYSIRTKGDANPASIPGTDFPITEEEYIGKVAYVIPQIGYVTRILTPPINYIIIGIIIAVMVIKQISKGRKEKEIASTIDFESFDQNNPNESTSTFDDLNNIPKDKEYSEISDEVRNAALREEGINPDSEKKNPQDTNSDSTKKKPDE